MDEPTPQPLSAASIARATRVPDGGLGPHFPVAPATSEPLVGADHAPVFRFAPIDGVVLRELTLQRDARGWLVEWWRSDDHAAIHQPCMGYTSVTAPGVSRGPHEHHAQSDWFIFLGPGEFLLYLWDNRPASPTFRRRMRELVGEHRPASVVVPPGVVHAYRNTGAAPAWVLNAPDQLYRGPNRGQPVDEIRHELDAATPYLLD